MRGIDSNAAFNNAAKHLFRHLHEPAALRANPLVRRFFQPESVRDPELRHERSATARIHDLVRQGADHHRDADLNAGKGDRALRRHAIVTRQCLERQPIREVAAELGISYYHCYRERADICRRIARFIDEDARDATPEYLDDLDELAVLTAHVMRRSVYGDREGTFRECAELVALAPSPQRKIEALRTSAFVALRFGDAHRAGEAYAAARRLYRDRAPQEPSQAWSVARSCIELTAAKLAYYAADRTGALRMAELATRRLEPIRERAEDRVRELYLTSLYELGSAFCNLGNLDRAHVCLADAQTELSGLRAPAPELRARIAVGVWKLRNHLVMNAASWYPSAQRRRGLAAAFEQAYAAGALCEALSALVALTEFHVFAKDDLGALRAARLAVLLAQRQPSRRIRTQTAIQVAMLLLSTEHWEYGCSLLPTGADVESYDAYHRAALAYVAAERAFRLRRYDEAWQLAKNGNEVNEYAALTISRQLVAAAAAHKLERPQEAHALLERTIPVAEGLGSAPTLRDAYSAGAAVTGDARYRRRAKDVAEVLIA